MHHGLKKILYVDDEHINLELFKINFRTDYHVLTADSALKGLELISIDPINVIVSDLKMPGMNGLEFIEKIKQCSPEKVCILLTAYVEPNVMQKALNEKLIFRYATKPWLKSNLTKIIEQAFSKYNENITCAQKGNAEAFKGN
jgi:response regulator RpfG family c-di-GMP phosphodiesterase